MKMGVLIKSLSLLAKCTRVFRPAEINFTGNPPNVSITADVIIVQYKGVIDRGQILWFTDLSNILLPALEGIPLGSELNFKNMHLETEGCSVMQRAMSLDLRPTLQSASKKWNNGDVVVIELKAPCSTDSFLDMPGGRSGERSICDTCVKTTFKIRKKPSFREIPISSYSWRQSLRSLMPIESVVITKNGSDLTNLRMDLVRNQGRSALPAEVRFDAVDAVDAFFNQDRTMDNADLLVPMEFRNSDDEYVITVLTKKL